MENGEELLATPDTDEELNEVFDPAFHSAVFGGRGNKSGFIPLSFRVEREATVGITLSALIRFKILDFIDLDADCHSQCAHRLQR